VYQRFVVTVVLVVVTLAATVPARAQSDNPAAAIARTLVGTELVFATTVETFGDWAIATALADHTDPVLVIAHREASGWAARSPITADPAAYNDWVDALPAELIGPGDRSSLHMLMSVDVQAAQSAPPFTRYRLPYPESWTAFMSQGPFGGFSHTDYWALDLVLQSGTAYTTAIVAAKDGVVMYAKDVSNIGGLSANYRGYSNGVIIRHGPGEYSWYWHLAHNSVPADVQPGRAIEAGTVIGFMGSTGYSGGPHLHFHVSEAFSWAGCSPVTGCPGREMRANMSPWNKTVRGVDFVETTDESRWVGCNSRSACGLDTPSSNKLHPTDGAVLYWSRDFHGPGWKIRDGDNQKLPPWLSGRANSLALPAGWWASLAAPDGQRAAFEASQAVISPTQRPQSINVSPVQTITKRIRNDASSARPYQFGSADPRVLRVSAGEYSAASPCTWQARSLSPGYHELHWVIQRRGGAPPDVSVALWPFAPAAPCVSALLDPGPPTGSNACTDPVESNEPNDLPSTAVAMTLNTTQTHATGTPGDADWLVITATAGSRYAIDTRDLDIDADTVIQLYDAAGTALIASNDDAGAGYASRLEFRAPSTGDYRVRLAQWDPGIAACGTRFTVGYAQMAQVFLPTAVRR
jgi:murein DD-endopeptidase MepM/ murein hydrolase activator NlpD